MSGRPAGQTTAQPAAPSDDTLLLEWRVHLLRRAPRKAVAVCLAILAVGVVAYFSVQHLLFALAAMLLLAGALSDFLFPIRFRLTRRDVASYNLLSIRKLPWERVRRVYEMPDGVKLSPLRRPSRLEAFRGVYLWFDGNRDEVLTVIHKLMPTPHRAVQKESAAPHGKTRRRSRRRRGKGNR